MDLSDFDGNRLCHMRRRRVRLSRTVLAYIIRGRRRENKNRSPRGRFLLLLLLLLLSRR